MPFRIRVLALVILLALAAAVASCLRGVRPAPPAPDDREYVFTAEPSTIAPGESARLVWRIPGATSVSLASAGPRDAEVHPIGKFGASGAMDVQPREDTVYVVSCEGSKAVTCASVSVRVRVRAH